MGPQPAAKVGVAMTVPFLAALPFDAWWILFVPLGLTLGWLARAGRMVGDRKPWSEIRRDMLVSFLIGGANGVIAALIIWRFDLTYLPGLAVSFVCAFGGIQSLDTAVIWIKRQFEGQSVDPALTSEDIKALVAEGLGDNRNRTAAALAEQAIKLRGEEKPRE